ncbi:MAG TPA: hypothetical protein ENI85_04245 [Deltaproteobacteria bacterium]|nr:hypothetical protein [Deltaproteobacteria bacterium]
MPRASRPRRRSWIAVWVPILFTALSAQMVLPAAHAWRIAERGSDSRVSDTVDVPDLTPSLVSSLELRVHDPDDCAVCRLLNTAPRAAVLQHAFEPRVDRLEENAAGTTAGLRPGQPDALPPARAPPTPRCSASVRFA